MTHLEFRWSTLALCGWLLLSAIGSSAQAFQADREGDRRRTREEERQAAQRERMAALEAEREALQREIEELRAFVGELEHEVRESRERGEATAREAREQAEREYAERLHQREAEMRARHAAEREELQAATRESMRASVEAVNAEMIEVARALRSLDQSYTIRGIQGHGARTAGSVYVDRHAAELRGEEPAAAVLPEPLVLSGASCRTTGASADCVEDEVTPSVEIDEEESTIKQEALDDSHDTLQDDPPVPTIDVESAVDPQPTEIKNSDAVELRATTSTAPATQHSAHTVSAACDPCPANTPCDLGCGGLGQAPPGAVFVNGVYVEATGCYVGFGGTSSTLGCGCGAACASAIGSGCYAGSTTFRDGQSAEYYLRGRYIGGGGARYSFYPAGITASPATACEDCD